MSKEEKKVEATATETKASVDNKEMLELIKELKSEVKELKQRTNKQTVEHVIGYSDIQRQEAINNPYENKSEKELMDLASKEMVERRNEFNDRVTYTKDIRYSAETDFNTWEEIAVLRAYDEMDDNFKKKFGSAYENLRQGKYHEILDEEVKRVEKFKKLFQEIDGNDLPKAPYVGYNRLRQLHAQIFFRF